MPKKTPLSVQVITLLSRALGRAWASRPARVAFVLVALLAWAFQGQGLLAGGDPRARLRGWLDVLVDSDPVAADLVRTMGNEAELDSLALAVGVQLEGEGASPESFGKFVQGISERERLPWDVELGAITLEDLSEWPGDDREGFLYGYGSLFGVLEEAGATDAAEQAFEVLEQLRADPVRWGRVKEDPIALTVFCATGDLGLLDVYLEHAAWLGEAFESLPLPDGELAGERLRDILAAVGQFPDEARRLVVEEETGGLGLPTFALHSELISHATRAHGLPLEEVVTVLTLNPDAIELLEGTEADRAAKLAFIRGEFPLTWKAAQLRPFTLRLALVAPADCEEVIESWEHLGASSLLYTAFGDGPAEREAIRSVARFGDLAMLVFSRWGDPDQLERMSSYLLDPELGVRTVPFVLMYQDAAFSRIEDDKAWVDRYFEEDGTPRRNDDWLADVPIVGAVGHAVKTKLAGYPLEYSEIGWAAWDVADAVLLVATFGGSAVVTTGVKAGSKAGLKAAAKTAGKTAGKRTIREGGEAAIRSATAAGAKKASDAGSRKGLKRALAAIRGKAGQAIGLGARGTAASVRLALGALVRTPRAVGAGYRAINKTPLRKKLVRGVVAASVFLKVTQRTLPALPEIAAGLGRYTGEVFGKVVLASTALLGAALQGFVAELTGMEGAGIAVAFYTVLLAQLAWLCRELFRWRQERREQARKVARFGSAA